MHLFDEYFGAENWWMAAVAVVLSGTALLLYTRRAPRTRSQLLAASFTSVGGAMVLVYLLALLSGVWECMHGNCL